MPNKTDELYVVKKGKKYLKGHSYASVIGYTFTWSIDLSGARIMTADVAKNMEILSGGKMILLNENK